MYSPAVTSGLGFVYKLGQCLAQLIISRVREWRSSRYGGTEKVSAGLLGAAPASGSPSRGMAVGLIWPGCTPHPLPTTGVSLLGLGFGPRQLVSGSLSPSVPGSAGLGVLLLGGAPSPRVYRGVRRLRASHPSALAVSGLLLIVWPRSVPCPVQHAWGGLLCCGSRGDGSPGLTGIGCRDVTA